MTKRAKEEAAPVSAEPCRDLEARARPTLKELLLSDEARSDELVGPRPELGSARCLRSQPICRHMSVAIRDEAREPSP